MPEKQTILIFDDDQELLDLCTVILEKKGFVVHTSENCNNIFEKISRFKPDVILMDNWIPDIGGVESTILLKSNPETKNIPVVFFSANNDVPALAAKAGADTYITKPFNISDLEDTILEMVNR
ncbi:MAG: response regulator receiver protein [Chitinophagaceae bacterium]|nr:response regulator receiver protein [Chitinophagaceae bacterium]